MVGLCPGERLPAVTRLVGVCGRLARVRGRALEQIAQGHAGDPPLDLGPSLEYLGRHSLPPVARPASPAGIGLTQYASGGAMRPRSRPGDPRARTLTSTHGLRIRAPAPKPPRLPGRAFQPSRRTA